MINQFLIKKSKLISLVGFQNTYLGDSITWGSNGSIQLSTCWVNQTAINTSTTTNNLGVQSMSLLSVHSPNFMSVYDSYIPTYSVSYGVLCFEFGVNDIYWSTYSATSEFITALKTVIDNCISKSWSKKRIIVWNCPYFTLGQSNQTKIQALNTSILSFCNTNNILMFDAYVSNTSLAADNIHPSNQGHTNLANGLNTLLHKNFKY
jgi:hypothetical protein